MYVRRHSNTIPQCKSKRTPPRSVWPRQLCSLSCLTKTARLVRKDLVQAHGIWLRTRRRGRVEVNHLHTKYSGIFVKWQALSLVIQILNFSVGFVLRDGDFGIGQNLWSGRELPGRYFAAAFARCPPGDFNMKHIPLQPFANGTRKFFRARKQWLTFQSQGFLGALSCFKQKKNSWSAGIEVVASRTWWVV